MVDLFIRIFQILEMNCGNDIFFGQLVTNNIVKTLNVEKLGFLKLFLIYKKIQPTPIFYNLSDNTKQFWKRNFLWPISHETHRKNAHCRKTWFYEVVNDLL